MNDISIIKFPYMTIGSDYINILSFEHIIKNVNRKFFMINNLFYPLYEKNNNIFIEPKKWYPVSNNEIYLINEHNNTVFYFSGASFIGDTVNYLSNGIILLSDFPFVNMDFNSHSYTLRTGEFTDDKEFYAFVRYAELMINFKTFNQLRLYSAYDHITGYSYKIHTSGIIQTYSIDGFLIGKISKYKNKLWSNLDDITIHDHFYGRLTGNGVDYYELTIIV